MSTPAAEAPRVKVQVRWLLVVASMGIMYALMGHRLALMIYAGTVGGLLLMYLLWLPRWLREREARFRTAALKLVAKRPPALEAELLALGAKQWHLRHLGRPHVVPKALATCAHIAGLKTLAQAQLQLALRYAPAGEQAALSSLLSSAESVLKVDLEHNQSETNG